MNTKFWFTKLDNYDKYKEYRKYIRKILNRIVPSKRFSPKIKTKRIHNNQYNEFKPKVPPIDKKIFKQELIFDEWIKLKDKEKYENRNYWITSGIKKK